MLDTDVTNEKLLCCSL